MGGRDEEKGGQEDGKERDNYRERKMVGEKERESHKYHNKV